MAAMGGSELGWNRKEGIGCHDDRHYPRLAAIPGERGAGGRERRGGETGVSQRHMVGRDALGQS